MLSIAEPVSFTTFVQHFLCVAISHFTYVEPIDIYGSYFLPFKLEYCHYTSPCSMRIFWFFSSSCKHFPSTELHCISKSAAKSKPHTWPQTKTPFAVCMAMRVTIPNAPIKYLWKQFQNNSAI